MAIPLIDIQKAKRIESSMIQNWILDSQRLLKFGTKLAQYGAGPALGHLLGFRTPAWAQLLRRFLEDMGSTYLKLGQYLAIRFDLLPKDACEELGNLFDQVKPVPYQSIRQQIERELGRPIEDLFASFDHECLAAASIAQVHKAVSRDGRALAIKVQRPGVDRVIAADLRNLRRLAWVVDVLKLTRTISLVDAVDEFADYTIREIDFISEGRTADFIRATIVDVTTPEVIWKLSSRRVLSMAFIEGISLAKLSKTSNEHSDSATVELPGCDMEDAVRRLASATLKQLFVLGYFHADPHPGNILIGQNGLVALVDFGIFGQLNVDQRKALRDYVANLLAGNINEAYRWYEKLLTFSSHTDRTAFRAEVKDVMHTWLQLVRDPYSEPSERHVGSIADKKARLLYKYHVQLDINTLLFWKTLIVLDGTALRLLPDFDLAGVLGDFFKAVQPSVEDRILETLSDPKASREISRLLTDSTRNTARVQNELIKEHLFHRVRCETGTLRSARHNHGIRCLCVGIFTLAGCLLSESGPVRVTVEIAGASAMVLLARLWLRQPGRKR